MSTALEEGWDQMSMLQVELFTIQVISQIYQDNLSITMLIPPVLIFM